MPHKLAFPHGQIQGHTKNRLVNLSILSGLKQPFSYTNPHEYTFDRISRLRKEFDALKQAGKEFTKEGAELEFRLRSLGEGLRSSMELDSRTIRWSRYFFDCGYRHFEYILILCWVGLPFRIMSKYAC